MKLLLVDDESITREGLINSIDWASLCIDEVLEAQDGLEALSIAQKRSPEIIMTDVRMPHMDGVSFAAKIRELLPNSCIIFMSGYSDKEYLQAAIRMRAVSYVEKPIDPSEITSAIREAIKLHDMLCCNQQYRTMQNREKFGRLALLLTADLTPGSASYNEFKQFSQDLGLNLDARTCLRTVLVRTFPPFPDLNNPKVSPILKQLNRMAQSKPFRFLCGMQSDSTLVFQIYARNPPPSSTQKDFFHFFLRQLKPSHKWMLAPGPFVQGTEQAVQSYNKARALLKTGFFYDYNTILEAGKARPLNLSTLEQAVSDFGTSIAHHEEEKAQETASRLYKQLKETASIPPSKVKDTYFKLFIALEQAYHFQFSLHEDSDQPIWDRILSCYTLGELHQMLSDGIRKAASRSQEQPQEGSAADMMIHYTRKNYQTDTISVRDISGYVGLSTAYACTLFKVKTGKTMNQYLTDYRIEQAKQLLLDPRIKISEISARVGYVDGNYFSKSFKKVTGLTPSEYREKLLS